MALFRYKVIDREGQAIKGVAELPFDNPISAHEYYERKGCAVIALEPVNAIWQPFYSLSTWSTKRKIKKSEIAEFLRNIAVMLKAGIPIISALQDAAEYAENPALRTIADEIRMSLESGNSLSSAMEKQGEVFPDSVLYLCRIGEETGLLDQTLLNAAEHINRIGRINVDVKKALIYPVVVFFATLLACVFWMYYTVPSMTELYQQMQVELPAITKVVMNASDSLRHDTLYYIFGLLAAMLAISVTYKKHRGFKYWVSKCALKIPVVGKLIRYSNMAFVFEYFSLLVRSGVDIYKSLGVIAAAVPNEVYKENIKLIQQGVAKGNSLSDEFKRTKSYPNFIIRMLMTGERSGKLEEQARFISDEYTTRVNDTIDKLKTLVEPFAIFLVGGFMIFIIGALFLPIYNLIGNIGNF